MGLIRPSTKSSQARETVLFTLTRPLRLMDNFADTGLSKRVDAVIRFAFIAAVSLLSASAGVSGSGSSSSLRLSRYLTLGGYCVFAVILVSLVSMQLWLFRRRSQLLPSSRLVSSFPPAPLGRRFSH